MRRFSRIRQGYHIPVLQHLNIALSSDCSSAMGIAITIATAIVMPSVAEVYAVGGTVSTLEFATGYPLACFLQ